jgi:post-segregation antitoxin (ccd killing protein)
MPKVSIYLPDALYREAQARKLPLSALSQQAVETALRESDRRDWVARVRSRPQRCHTTIDTALLLTEVREEFGH